MFHPLAPNLSDLTDDELHKKLGDLNQRLGQAFRFGPSGAIGQLQMLQAHYQEEVSRRHQKQIEELSQRSGNFKNIIDIK